MKRIAQLAAILMIGLLAFQPAIASQPCTLSAGPACMPGCPMAQMGMGPDCPMAGRTATDSCPANCCSQSLFPAMNKPAAAQGVKLVVVSPLVSLPLPLMVQSSVPAIHLPSQSRASSPPRYLLNQTFRI